MGSLIALARHFAEAGEHRAHRRLTERRVARESARNHPLDLGFLLDKSKGSGTLVLSRTLRAAGEEFPFIGARLGLGVNLTWRHSADWRLCKFTSAPEAHVLLKDPLKLRSEWRGVLGTELRDQIVLSTAAGHVSSANIIPFLADRRSQESSRLYLVEALDMTSMGGDGAPEFRGWFDRQGRAHFSVGLHAAGELELRLNWKRLVGFTSDFSARGLCFPCQ
jgi:hypothetical protein